jgi:hypothetical protein
LDVLKVSIQLLFPMFVASIAVQHHLATIHNNKDVMVGYIAQVWIDEF